MNASAKLNVVSLILALFFWMALLPEPVAAEESFYKGKTVRIVVGFPPGGGFDTFSRILARHLPHYLPGNPSTLVQNMPGAASLAAANRVYTMQPGDGLTIVNFIYQNVFQYFLGDPTVKFDPRKYKFLGEPTIGSVPTTLFVRTDLPIRNFKDLKNSKKTVFLGGSARSGLTGVGPAFLESIGLPIKSVLGYGGSAPVFAAIERKEVDGRFTSQESVQTRYRRFLDEGMLRPILSFGSDPRVTPIPGVATLDDLGLDGEQRRLAEFLINSWRHLRLYAVPPGVPPERLALLREAFDKMLKAPKVIKDGERQGVRVSPTSWQKIEANIKDMAEAPRDMIRKYKKLAGIN